MFKKIFTKKNIIIASIIVGVALVSVLSVILLKSDIHITLDSSGTVDIAVNTKYKEPTVYACYGNKITCKKIKVVTFGKVDTKKIGTYKVRYKATYKNKSKTIYNIVKVEDKDKPDLSFETDEFYVCPNEKMGEYKYKAEDNYDKDLTDKVQTKIEYDKIIFRVSDSSGNVTTKSFNYIKEDKDKPTITLKGSTKKYVLLNSNYQDEGYEANDYCDGDLTDKVQVTHSVDSSKPGTYHVDYEVSDSSGNTAKVTRDVIVYQKQVTVNPKDGTIYLTFDDGPGPYTAKLLDILKQYNVKATFFVTNQYPGYEDMITREFNEGHAVALHTYTHNYAQIYSSMDNYFADLYNINEKVKNLTGGFESKLIRFPGGSSNTVSRRYAPGIMTSLATEVENRGYKYFDWNVDSDDAGRARSPETVYNNVVSNLKSNGYSVILQHDVKSYSVDAVESIIKYGLENGFTFKTLDITSPGAHQGINN